MKAKGKMKLIFAFFSSFFVLPILADQATSKESSSENSVDIAAPIVSALQAPPTKAQAKSETSTTRNTAKANQPASHKLIIGNWIAQWDTQYKAWFYYNIKTATSTWIKPPELAHVAFKSQGSVRRAPEGSGGGVEHSGGVGRSGGGRQNIGGGRQSEAGGAVGKSEGGPQTLHNAQMFYRQPYIDSAPLGSSWAPGKKVKQQTETDDRLLVSDYETGDFYGFNTTYFTNNRGVIGGLLDSFNGIYENIVKDYVTDVYTDVIEGYSIATIKLFGWFFVGSMLLLKGTILDWLVTSTSGGRSFDGNMYGGFGDSTYFRLPNLEKITGLYLEFPVDNELLKGCYGNRPSCLAKDLPAEISYMMSRAGELKEFIWRWAGMTETIGQMIEEGEL